MSLSEQLRSFSETARAKIPADVLEKFDNFIQHLQEGKLVDKAKKIGEKVSNFILPNARGEQVSLDKLLESGPVVLSFYRGGWCPFCNIELRALQDALPEIHSLGAQLVAISPQSPDQSLSTAEKNNLEFEVLSDLGNRIAHEFGLVFELGEELRPLYKQMGVDLFEFNGDESYQLPIAATYVIRTDGIVAAAYVDVNYSTRMEPAEIVNVLRNL